MKKNWKYVLLLGALCLTACMEKHMINGVPEEECFDGIGYAG